MLVKVRLPTGRAIAAEVMGGKDQLGVRLGLGELTRGISAVAGESVGRHQALSSGFDCPIVPSPDFALGKDRVANLFCRVEMGRWRERIATGRNPVHTSRGVVRA
jgi:hypothetical protein